MGLLINSNGDKQITIDGTNINLDSIYLRIAFNALVDGKTCEVALYSFASKDMFIEKKPIYTNVPTSNLYVMVDELETQSIDFVLLHLKKYFEDELGYIVQITN